MPIPRVEQAFVPKFVLLSQGVLAHQDHDKTKKKLSNKALSASALSEKCSFTLSKLRFFSLRAASK